MPLLPASSAFALRSPFLPSSFLLYAPPWPPTENPPLNFQLLFLSPLLSLVLSHHPGIPFLSYPRGGERFMLLSFLTRTLDHHLLSPLMPHSLHMHM